MLVLVELECLVLEMDKGRCKCVEGEEDMTTCMREELSSST